MEARVGVDGGSARMKFLLHQSWPQQPQITQIGTVQQFLTGGIARAFSKTCTAPLARLTILFQILRSISGLEGNGEHSYIDALVHFVGGGLTGMTDASATYPLDLVRTRLAAKVKTIRLLK